MKRIIRLTESDLARIVKRVINEEAGKKIPNEARFTGSLRGDKAPYLNLKAVVGGTANKQIGNPDVIEFDAKLTYTPAATSVVYNNTGDEPIKNAGKTFDVKGYYGCKTGKVTAKNPSTGSVESFSWNQMDPSSEFKDWTVDSGLCS